MYTELPPTNYAKDAGIRGLKQIALQTRDHHDYPTRVEIVNRYFVKYINRMNKSKYDPEKGIWVYVNIPLTTEEKTSLESELMEIIAKTPEEEHDQNK